LGGCQEKIQRKGSLCINGMEVVQKVRSYKRRKKRIGVGKETVRETL